MYIKNISIENFKCFKDHNIIFDKNFNLIIGANNSGKSTLFEALRLWQLAVQQFYTARTQKKSGNIGFYKRYSYRALEVSDLSFLRIQDIRDVFYNKSDENLPFIVKVTFSDDINTSQIPISFKRTSRDTLNCKIDVNDEKELKIVSDKLFKTMGIANNDTFRNRIRLAYVPPKFNLPNKEILFSEKNEFISENLILGRSQLVIRNILHNWSVLNYRRETKTSNATNLKSNLNQIIPPDLFEEKYNSHIKPYLEGVLKQKIQSKQNYKKQPLKKIESGLFEILKQKFDFKSYRDPTKELNLSIKNSVDGIEISQLGSGTINVLNILSVLEYNNQTIDKASTKCNLLLLDEPDSHLHSNLQNGLFSYLHKESNDSNTQIFIITHNSGLISQFERVLFFNTNDSMIKSISISSYLENHLREIDYSQYEIIKQLNEAKKTQEQLQKQLNESSSTVVLFEGNTDIKIFKTAFNKLYGKEFPFVTKEKVSSASQIPPNFNGHNNPNGFLIGIFDNDHPGRSQFKNIDNSFRIKEDIYKIKNNALAILLPVPKERDIPFFRHNLTIEYLFSDDSLKEMGVTLIKDDGENYFKINPKEGTQAYCIKDSEKSIVSDNCSKLSPDAFKHFKPIFEKIFKFTKYEVN